IGRAVLGVVGALGTLAAARSDRTGQVLGRDTGRLGAVVVAPALDTAGRRVRLVEADRGGDPLAVGHLPVRPVTAGELGGARVGQAVDRAHETGRGVLGGETRRLQRVAAGLRVALGAPGLDVAAEVGEVDDDVDAVALGGR